MCIIIFSISKISISNICIYFCYRWMTLSIYKFVKYKQLIVIFDSLVTIANIMIYITYFPKDRYNRIMILTVKIFTYFKLLFIIL